MKIHSPHSKSSTSGVGRQLQQHQLHQPSPIHPPHIESDRRRTTRTVQPRSDDGDMVAPEESTVSKLAIPYSSSLSALSSVAHDELLELERKETIRRARYELTRAELEARVTKPSRSAGASPDSTPFFGPGSAILPQHSVYCDGDSLSGLTPRLPACHHEECHKSYRTLLKMTNRLASSHEVLSSHYAHADGGHLTSHAHNNATPSNHSRAGHRHHPYELPQSINQPGRKTSPVDTTPSPISTDDSSELPPLPHHAPTNTGADNYEYYTPSTSPFLHAVRNMNMGRSRTSSRVPSRAPSPVPLHLPPAVTAISSVNFNSYDSGRTTIGKSDRHHRSHRSHPSLHSPYDAVSEHQYHPYPHSHGGTPPGTPAPLMMGRQKRSNSGGVSNQPSKHSIDALLSGGRREPVSTDLHYTMDATAAPTPSLSSSSNSSVSGGRHQLGSATDPMMSGETLSNPPLSFPPPPKRSRTSSDIVSPVRSLAGSPEHPSTIHTAFASSHPPLPPLIPGLPTSSSSSSTSPLFPRSSGSSLSSPTTPNSSHSHLAHSVRIAFGMTPIHPPNYFSSRGRSTIGFGSSSIRGSARSPSPPIILPPLKIATTTTAGAGSGDVSSSRGSDDGRDADEVTLPHLDSLTKLVGVRPPAFHTQNRSEDDMEVDDLH